MNPKQKYISSVLNPGASNPSSAYRPQTTLGTTPVDSLMGKSSSYSNIQKKQPTPITPANTSATSPATPKITSPAGQAYVSAQVNQPATPAPTSTPATPAYQDTPDYKAYLSYTRNKENPSEAELARKQYEASMKRLVDAQNERERAQTEARKGVEKTLTTGGGLKSGTQAGAGVYQRRAGDDVADLSLAESAAARSAGLALDVYDPYRTQQANEAKQLSIEEATTLGVPFGTTYGEAKALGKIPEAPGEAFNLSEGQARYDANGNLIAERGKTYAPGTGTSASSGGGILGADGKPLKLLAGQVDTIANYDNTMSAAERALGLLEGGVSTGPVSNLLLQGKKFAGYGDETQLKMEQLLGKIRADFMKAISGAAVSEQEVKRLSKFLPDLGDQENVIKSKLENLLTELASSRDVYVKTIGGASSQPSVSNATQMQLPDGTIVTLQPDGTYN